MRTICTSSVGCLERRCIGCLDIPSLRRLLLSCVSDIAWGPNTVPLFVPPLSPLGPRSMSGLDRRSHFSSAQNQQNPHRRLTVSRPTRRIRGPRLTAVNLCRLFGRTEPRAAEQDSPATECLL